MPDAATIGLLLGLGTWSALDGTALGQILISRPLVSATLAGIVLSDPTTGLLVGLVLEGVHLGDLPAGGVRLPEPGPGGVGAAFLAFLHPGPGGLAAAVALGAASSLAGGLSVHGQRRLNGRLLFPGGTVPKTPRGLARRHWACVLADAGRGLLLTGATIAAALAVPASWPGRWTLPLAPTLALLGLPALLAGGALLRTWVTGRRRGAVLLLGGCGGVLLAALL